ncbi:MAG: VOC family protein, partial [Prosthecobacter sp.]|nr:VOC family protein [Prosthecobacter sp.]
AENEGQKRRVIGVSLATADFLEKPMPCQPKYYPLRSRGLSPASSVARPGLKIGALKRFFYPNCLSYGMADSMNVERLKYVIWAVDMNRAVAFYVKVFGGTVLKQNEIISEVAIAGSIIGIHGGGEGGRTWTGLSLQVPDVIAGAAEIVAAGGQLVREPQPENGEPPHLAMCVDSEGNEIMLTRKRSQAFMPA